MKEKEPINYSRAQEKTQELGIDDTDAANHNDEYNSISRREIWKQYKTSRASKASIASWSFSTS